MQVARYFPILSTEKAFQVHIPIFFAVTADEQIVSKQVIWSLMKSHGNDEFNLQMKNNISDFSFNPVNVLKKICHKQLKNMENRELAKKRCFVWIMKENIVLGAMQTCKKMQTF